MKNIAKILSVLLISQIVGSCRDDNFDISVVPPDNDQNTNLLIEVFDRTLQDFFTSPNKSDEEINDFFIKSSQENGLKVMNKQDVGAYVPVSERTVPYIGVVKEEYKLSFTDLQKGDNIVVSEKAIYYLNAIGDVHNTVDHEYYKQKISNLEKEVMASRLPIGEEQLLVDNIQFMVSFVYWMETLEDKYSHLNDTPGIFLFKREKDDSWWTRWGRCAAGAVGEALTAGVVGCGAGAVVGAVPGCVAGGIIGAIGGGLHGAATFCG